MLLFLLEKEKSSLEIDMLFCGGGWGQFLFLIFWQGPFTEKSRKYRFLGSSFEHLYKYSLKQNLATRCKVILFIRNEKRKHIKNRI